MKHKKKIIVGISIIALFLVVAIGVTYSLWSKTFAQSGENRLASDCFHIVFQEVEDSGITLENTFPILDEEGKRLKPYEFSITNACNVPVEYQVNFETTNNTTMYDQYVKFMFQENIPVLLTELENTGVTLNNGKSAYKLEKGYLDAEETKNYKVRIWMDEKVTQNDENVMNSIFEGKIVINVSYLSNYDSNKPVGKVIATREGNIVTIDVSNSFDADSDIKKYYYSKDGENWIASDSNHYSFEENISYGNGIETVRNFYDSRIKIVYVKVEDEFGNMSEVVSNSVQELYYDETVDNNLRYVGKDPNNYVLFNNELWRIIGVLQTPEGKRLKLVRDEIIGNYAYNVEYYIDGEGYSHNWLQSTLREMLNNGPYWNRTSGMCYQSENGSGKEVACDFSNTGLTNESKNLIDYITWNLGGYSTQNDLTTSSYYFYERGDIVFPGDPIVWKGYVGLFYPSDYGYATSGGKDVDRNTCLEQNLITWNRYRECANNDWLRTDNIVTLFFTDSVHANWIYTVSYHGYVSNENGSAVSDFDVRPTVYLKENVNFVKGTGSREKPFELSLS